MASVLFSIYPYDYIRFRCWVAGLDCLKIGFRVMKLARRIRNFILIKG